MWPYLNVLLEGHIRQVRQYKKEISSSKKVKYNNQIIGLAQGQKDFILEFGHVVSHD